MSSAKTPSRSVGRLSIDIKRPTPGLASALRSLQLAQSTESARAQMQRLGVAHLTDFANALEMPARKLQESMGVSLAASAQASIDRVLTDVGSAEAASLGELEHALELILSGQHWPRPRRLRKPTDFFASFEVEVSSLNQLLAALSVLQQKNSHLGLVWRGQEDAAWPIDSSLTRALRAVDRGLSEDHLITVERFQIAAAARWGVSSDSAGMGYLAELQHQGAPTRLIDVSLDPEVAVWFAVGTSDEASCDGRVVVWGRGVPLRRGQQHDPPRFLTLPDNSIFWHEWETPEQRREHRWGTGRTVPVWQPSVQNKRMRAQRAAFLFDAEPVLEDRVLALFESVLGEKWRAKEIGQSTRVLGVPTRHDLKAKPNSAGMVPMFALRIEAAAKPEIRRYLETKGLTEDAIYPDRAGLVSYLRRASARDAE